MEIINNIYRDELLLGVIKISEFNNAENHSLQLKIIENLKFKQEQSGEFLDKNIKKAIRDLLRNGKYSPTGRGKPASEFLINSYLKSGEMFFINSIVDINNYLSIKNGVPASVFDMDKIIGKIEVRPGQESESYVFNNAGHQIKLKDLIVVADEQAPFGNPVKDSMRTKCSGLTRNSLGIIYCSKDAYRVDQLGEMLEEWRLFAKKYLDAKAVQVEIIGQ